MPNYQNSQIYKLVSNMTSDIYIGSCLMRLSTRLSGHKNKDNTCVSKKLFIDNAIITIVLIENFPCNTKNELKARELFHITANNCININKPFVCEIPYGDGKEWNKEYKLANEEQIITQRKEYNETHRERINTRQKKYDESHRDQYNTRRRARRAEKKLALNLQNNLNNNIII